MTAALLAATVAAWVYLAPTSIGGSTSYVVTSGVSMQPRFHTGDLALVRPAARYRVGEIVAYRSTLLHVIVLHRIVAIHDGHYTFKGDNNSFVDPVHPLRSDLVGALWLRIPHGGVALRWLHSPLVGAALAGGLGLLLLMGSVDRRRGRRRERRAGSDQPTPAPMPSYSQSPRAPATLRALLVACAVGALAFAAIGLAALTRPLRAAATRPVPFTQRANFGYRAAARQGPVYPNGVVSTGQPIFLQLAHRVRVSLHYRLQTAATAAIQGTGSVALQLTGPTGWRRSIPLSPARPFTGTTWHTSVVLDLPALQSLVTRVQKLTGVATDGYGIAVVARVHVHGRIARAPVTAGLTPALSFQLQPSQLQPSAGATPAAAPGTGSPGSSPRSSTGFSSHARGHVVTATSVPARFGVGSVAVPIVAVRWAALAGLLLCAGAALPLLVLLRRSQAFDESARIEARYGHLLVSIAPGDDLGWPPVDVTSIEALVRLAESSGQLILHSHDDEADVYLVNDNGSVYRYRAKLPKVIWGEWTEAPADQLAVTPTESAADPPAELAA